jgi:integrase
MPREARPWRVYKRADSQFWQVQWGGRATHREALDVTTERTRAEAEGEAARRWVARGGQGKTTKASTSELANLALAELIPLFIEHVEKTYRGKDPQFASRKGTDLVEYVAPLWKSADEITANAWEEAMLKLHHKKGGPLRWRSIAHVAQTLKAFLSWCQQKGVVAEVPKLGTPSTDEQRMDMSERRAFTEEEMEAFLWALALQEEGRALRIYTVLFETWQRKSTIEAMTLRWVDFKRETITIPAKHFKTRKEKIIDLTPRCAEAIKLEIEDWALTAGAKPDPDRTIFGRFNFHQSWNEKKKGGVFGRALTLAGIDPHGLTPHHATRHTAATLAMENGVGVLGAMAQGGWDSMQSMQRYTHSSLKHARVAARARSLVAR